MSVELIREHIPSMTDDDDRIIDDRRWNSMTDRFGQMEVDNADLAVRTCKCGVRVDGFYEYVDHLVAIVDASS